MGSTVSVRVRFLDGIVGEEARLTVIDGKVAQLVNAGIGCARTCVSYKVIDTQIATYLSLDNMELASTTHSWLSFTSRSALA